MQRFFNINKHFGAVVGLHQRLREHFGAVEGLQRRFGKHFGAVEGLRQRSEKCFGAVRGRFPRFPGIEGAGNGLRREAERRRGAAFHGRLLHEHPRHDGRTLPRR